MPKKVYAGAVKYVAKHGEYVIGVPACDMTAEEWSAVDEELRDQAMKLGLYAPASGVALKEGEE